MELINHHQAIESLRAVVAEAGRNHVYEIPTGFGNCRYVEQDSDGNLLPSCLVARALHRLGVPIEELAKWEGNSCEGMGSPQGDRSWRTPRAMEAGAQQLVTPLAADVLRAAQAPQDAGRPWGVCLDYAEATYASLEVSR